MIRLTNDEFKKAKKDLYIQPSRCVEIPADLYSDIMLITNSCGRGKTSYVFNPSGLLEDINRVRKNNLLLPKDVLNYEDIKPEEVLVLLSRKIVENQQLEKENVVEATLNDFDKDIFSYDDDVANRQGKFRALTAHKFGEWIKKDLVKDAPKVIVIDELHSIISETAFADSLLYTLHFLADNYKNIIKIGLTATPQILEKYMDNGVFTYKTIDYDLGAKYTAKNINIFRNGKIETLLKQYTFNQQQKAIIYVNSARQAYKLAQEYTENGVESAYLISDYNETEISGIKIAEAMKETGIKDYIIKYSKLPEETKVIFMNASCREGMNIKDESVKYVFCEAVDMITIEQVLGRLRQDLEEFNVVCNFRNYNLLQNNIQDAVNFFNRLDTATPTEKENIKIERYGAQEENSHKQKIVYKYHDIYYINQFIIGYLKYLEEGYTQLKNTENHYISRCGSRDMLVSDDYFLQLCRYAEKDGIQIKDLWQGLEECSQNNAISAFQQIENDWLDKPLTADDKKKLMKAFVLVDKNYNKKGWTTFKNLLIDNGYTVIETRKMIDGKRNRVSIIQKED